MFNIFATGVTQPPTAGLQDAPGTDPASGASTARGAADPERSTSEGGRGSGDAASSAPSTARIIPLDVPSASASSGPVDGGQGMREQTSRGLDGPDRAVAVSAHGSGRSQASGGLNGPDRAAAVSVGGSGKPLSDGFDVKHPPSPKRFEVRACGH